MSDKIQQAYSNLLGCLILFTAVLFINVTQAFFRAHLFIVPKDLAISVIAVLLLGVTLFRAKEFELSKFEWVYLSLFVFGISLGVLKGHHWSHLAVWSSNGFLAFWVLHSARRVEKPELQEFLVAVAVISACIISLAVLVEACVENVPWQLTFRRPVSLLGNRNSVAAYCGFGLILASVMYFSGKSRWYLAGIVLTSISIVICRTRGVWLPLLVMGVTGLIVASRRSDLRKKAAAFAAILIVVAVSVSAISWPTLRWRTESPYRETLLGLVDYQSGTGEARVLQLRLGIEILKSHLFLGSGPGGWRIYGPVYEERVSQLSSGRPVDVPMLYSPASDYVRFMVELGVLWIAGFVFFLIAMAAFFRRKDRTPVDWALFLGLLFFLFNTSFDKALYRAPTLVAILVSIGILFRNEKRFAIRLSVPAKSALFLVALLAFYVHVVSSIGRFVLISSNGVGTLERSFEIFPEGTFSSLKLRNAIQSHSSTGCDSLYSENVARVLKVLPNDRHLIAFRQQCLSQ